MKEMIQQRKGEYIFWKIEEEYYLLFLKNKKRKKEVEYKLSEEDRVRYYEQGVDYIKTLIDRF